MIDAPEPNVSLKHRAVSLRNRLHANRSGKFAVDGIAYLLGLCFDLTGGTYRADKLAFEVPKDQTTRRGRGSFMLGSYEVAECLLAKKYLSPDSAVLELGGCIGVVSCTANKLLSRPENHVVVEANPNLIPALTRNRDQNSCKFAVVQGVVANGPVYFSAASQMECGRVSESGNLVPSFTTDELEARYGIRFDTLIADIEGAEDRLLTENFHFLERLNLLIIEFHPAIIGQDQVSRLRETLAAAGLESAERRLDVEVYARQGL